MLNKIFTVLSALFLGAMMLSADVTGKYAVEMERPAGMEGRGGGGRMGAMQTTLTLKEEAGKLTGTAEMGSGERARKADITNGRIEGGKFSFETTMETPMGSMTMLWEGEVDGEALKGTRSMKDGDRPAQAFTAKRAD